MLNQAFSRVRRVFSGRDAALPVCVAKFESAEEPAAEPQLEHHSALTGWSADELAVLKPHQLSTTLPRPFVRKPMLPEDPTRRPPPRAAQAELYHRYVIDSEPVEVDDSLPGLRFAPLAFGDGLNARPTVAVDPAQVPVDRHAVYYFEFDIVDSFDSPNFWRTPQLLPYKAEPDILGRAGVRYSLFRSGHHEPGGVATVAFPFRATAMRLPTDWHDLDRAELERQALSLGFGLDRESIIREVFNFVRHTIVWSAQSQVRSTLDVFATGVGACGQANAVCSLLLEMNGVRSRGVSGFDPAVRLKNGHGGHSVAEVFDPESARWSYIDPYLDIYLPGVPAAELAAHPAGNLMLGAHHLLRPLRRQFMYRRYFDRLNRMIPASMLQLGGDESIWGTQWPLIKPREFEPRDLFPEEITIHARARYLLTNGQRVQHRSEIPVQASAEGIVASPWARTAFAIRPRELLAIA